jgi:hypothetical protein
MTNIMKVVLGRGQTLAYRDQLYIVRFLAVATRRTRTALLITSAGRLLSF